MFKPSKKLNASENKRLEQLEILGYQAPLTPRSMTEYVELCKKAGRKVKFDML